jgi:hypothetical protein
MLEETTDAAVTLRDLDPAEHLLVWGLRTIAVGHGDCAVLSRTFASRCGALGAPALQAYFTLVQLIGASARRRLRVHVPGCLCVSVDETAVVGIVAAAQDAVRGGDDSLLRMRLGFLARTEAADAIRHTAQALARALAAAGQALPVRIEPMPSFGGLESAQLRTMH